MKGGESMSQIPFTGGPKDPKMLSDAAKKVVDAVKDNPQVQNTLEKAAEGVVKFLAKLFGAG